MVRRLLLVMAVGWTVLLALFLARDAWEIPHRLSAAMQPDAEREALESGDPAWHGFLAGLHSACGDEAIVILVDGGAGREEFLSFRAAFELYPAPVRVVGTGRRLPASSGAVDCDDETAEWAIAHRARWIGRWQDRHPDRPAVARIVSVEGRVLRVERAPWPAPSGERAEPRYARWLAAWVALLLGVVVVIRRTVAGGAPLRSAWDRAGAALVAVAFILAVVRAIAPQSAWSTWDAWMIWDLKVKAVLHEGWFPVAYWHDPGYRYSHQESPLGWPWLLAVVAKGAGGYDARLARLVAPICTLAMGPLLAALAAEAGVASGGWLIAGAVTALPLAVEYASNGYVDWPLAVVLTGAMLALLRVRRGAAPGWVAGAWAGAAGWLKQEGMIAGLACIAVLVWFARGERRRRHAVFQAAEVWLLLVLPLVALRAWHHLDNEAYGAISSSLIREAPGRLWLVVRAAIRETAGPGRVGVGWIHHLPETWLLFWYLTMAALAAGWSRLRQPECGAIRLVVAAQAATMVGAYLTTNWNPVVLIGTSLDRLLLQMVPGVAILAAVSGLCAPVIRLTPKRGPS